MDHTANRIRERCKNDSWFFITNYCKTPDDKGVTRTFPDWPFLSRTHNRWQQEGRTVMSIKAVQNLVTWLAACNVVHDILFHSNIQDGYFSIGQEEAKKVKKRCQFILDHLPKDLFPFNQVGDSKSEIEIDHGSNQFSRAYFMTSSPYAGRGETWHRIVFDEAAFNRNFEDLYNANKSRCRFLNIFSSPPKVRSGYFYYLDQNKTQMEIDFDSIYWYENPEKKKDPDWERRIRASMTENAFKREHLCQYASEGGLVYDFDRNSHIVSPSDFPLYAGMRFYRGIDWGWNPDPFACIWAARWEKDGIDRWLIFHEIYKTETYLSDLAREIKAFDKRPISPPPKLSRDIPKPFTLEGKFHKQVSDSSGPREREELAKLGVRTIKCIKGPDHIMAKTGMVGDMMRPQKDGIPGLIIWETCKNTIWEFENYMRDDTGFPIDANNHIMDAIGDLILTVKRAEDRGPKGSGSYSFTW